MWRRALQQRFVLIVLLAGFFSSAATAAIFNADDRQYVSTAPGSPYSPIGIVSGGWTGHYTTGTLIDECHVLTSQHIFGSQIFPVGRRLRFDGAVGTKQWLSSAGTVVAAGGFEKHQSSGDEGAARASDWLLLRLDTCLGSTLGFANLRTRVTMAGELIHVQNAGYPVDKNRRSGLIIDPTCRISAVYALVWLNDCATLQGNSGGPIFRLTEASGRQQLEVYAIVSAGILGRKAMPFRQGWENQATPVSVILPHILAYISQSAVLAL